MKGKALQFVNEVLLSYKKTIKSKQLVDTCSKIVEPAIKNLSYVISEKFEYISKMKKDGEVEDNNYEFFIYQIILFFTRFITKEPIVDSFFPFAKQ